MRQTLLPQLFADAELTTLQGVPRRLRPYFSSNIYDVIGVKDI